MPQRLMPSQFEIFCKGRGWIHCGAGSGWWFCRPYTMASSLYMCFGIREIGCIAVVGKDHVRRVKTDSCIGVRVHVTEEIDEGVYGFLGALGSGRGQGV